MEEEGVCEKNTLRIQYWENMLKLEIKKRNIKIIYPPWLINSFGERSLEVN